MPSSLTFALNIPPKEGEYFIQKKLFKLKQFKPRKLIVFIELDIYEHNICVLSFYHKKHRHEKNKYQLRTNDSNKNESFYNGSIAKSIFQACLDAYYSLDQDYALVYHASEDVGKRKELNERKSAYSLFLRYYLENYEEYQTKSSLKYNTEMLYHSSFQFKKEADDFYKEFENQVKLEFYSDLEKTQ